MSWTSSQQKNDCVLTAISNLLGIPYADVEVARELVKGKGPMGGTFNRSIPDILNLLGYRVVVKECKIPANTPCLYSFHFSPRGMVGHMVAVIDGVAIEQDGRTWKVSERKTFRQSCHYVYPK